MSATFTALLHRVVEGHALTRDEARAAMDHLMSGEATPARTAAFLTALRMKGETADEIAGAAASMRAHARPFPGEADPLVDTCGTGGDGGGTFNISTAAAFVVAGAGVKVAKHGNRSVSSRCGSADVLEALGARIDLDPADAARCLETTGIAFLFAPHYHPAARHAAGPRRELAFRTLFNLVGPLANPAPVTHQVMGVYAPGLLETAARVLGLLGARRALAVHGHGGLDELALSGPSEIVEWRDGALHRSTVDPAALGFPVAPPDALAGGDAAENAAILREIFDGAPGAKGDAVCLNAGAALYVTGRAASLAEGGALAREAVASGAARRVLDAFVAFRPAGGGTA